MRKLLLGFLLLACGQTLLAQSGIKARVVDTLEKRNLHLASVSLLRKNDSILVKHTRTDKNGEFQLSPIANGDYILLITYPKSVDYADLISLDGSLKDLGTVPVIQKAAFLENVVVRQNIAIRMKGDTIEYKADSFRVAEGASVKDLLRKLPGLQVDKNGQITAQGQKVEKVLVDGEEFFSDDPAVVIENLRADAIDKVQSYDKKSDQAEFTGVDDGSRSKTLNLVLKDDKKKGYLGKMVVGGGTSERYSNEAMLNYFKGKKKVSVYGIASNTGKTGLGWDDRNTFGQGEDFGDAEVTMGAGFIMINSEGDDDFGDWGDRYYDEGIPTTLKGGAHLSNKWNADKQHANVNYSIRNMKANPQGNSLTKYILPDSAYYYRENHNSFSRNTRQLFNGTYDLKLDSASSIRLKLNGKLEHKENETTTRAGNENEELQRVSSNYTNNSAIGDSKVFAGNLLWRQKLKKKGRTVSLAATHKNSDSDSDGFLYSELEIMNPNGGPAFRDTTDQYKRNGTTVTTTTSKLVYTEPAGKKGILEFNYAFNLVNSNSDRRTFDKANNGKYEFLNNLFSIRYGLKYLSNSAGVKYQHNGKKLSANIGSNLGRSNYTQMDSSGKSIRNFRYINLFPSARINYRFAQQRSLNVNYSGAPRPPSVEQLQPIRENTNPLFITLGNPNLDQSLSHNFNLFFNDFKMLTGRSIFVNGGFNPVQNAIVTNQNTVNGITTLQYVNTQGNYNYWFYSSFGFKLKKADMHLGLSVRSNGNRFVNFVNGQKNQTNNRSVGPGFYISKYKENKFDFHVSSELEMNWATSNINSSRNFFWSQQHNGHFNYFITKKLQLGSDVNTYLRQKTDAFTGNNNFAVWDAYVQYKIFKKNNGIFKLEITDILKQRRGYERRLTSNQVYERNYNMLGRYAMLSFIWNFTKNPGTTK